MAPNLLSVLDDLRHRAAITLREIAAAHGRESLLYRGCESLWDKRAEEAFAAYVDGDFENAIALLDRGLQALFFGLETTESEAPLETSRCR